MLKEFDDTKAGVKGLVDAGVSQIPPFFVQPSEETPYKSATSSKIDIKIPVIDLKDIHEDTAKHEKVVQEIRHASETWGFFQLVNHGIPLDVMDGIVDGVRRFFEQPTETKSEFYSRDSSRKIRYDSNFDLYTAKAANWRDTLICVMAPNPPTPDEMPAACRDILVEYSNQVIALGSALLKLLSEALGLKPDHLGEMECAESYSMICNYYPACPEPDRTIGATAHTDPTFFTILLQDHIGGLQILYQNEWIDIEPVTGALVINIGDFMQLISNDQFKSALHRVLANKVGPRVSVASFVRSNLSSSGRLYGPIKELLSEDNPPKFKETTVRDYVIYCRNRGLVGSTAIDLFRL